MNNTEWAFQTLVKFLNEKPYGEITFTVQNGKVVNSKYTVSEKPPVDRSDIKE